MWRGGGVSINAVRGELLCVVAACLVRALVLRGNNCTMTTQDDLARVITFANGKGGAGKTSTAVNVAGLSAAAGWRTLLIDLDPQGNVGHDLGYTWEGRSDHGQHLVDALVGANAISPPLVEVRSNLDVVPGGEVLDDLEDLIAGRARRNKGYQRLLADALKPIANDYDLILIDTPPTRPMLLQLALAATRWIVVPTRADRSSIEGLRTLANQIGDVREVNPHLEILGAVLFDTGIAATVIRRNAAEDIETVLDGAAPLFSAVIRHSQSAAVEAREKGMLIYELAEQVDTAEPYWKALQEGRRPVRLPGTAPALADDYVLLCQEILTSIAAHEKEGAKTA